MQDAATLAPTPAALIARARAMIPVLAERAAKAEVERRVAQETIADMQAAGFFRVLQPKRWGGYEMDMATYFEIQLALAQGDMSVAWIYGVVGVHPWLMGLLEERAAQDVWGADDTMLVSSSLMPAGTLTRQDGGFRLSGRWKFSSGCQHCGWAFLGVNAARDPHDPPDRCVLLVPRSDYQIVDTWHVAGLKATGSHDIVVEAYPSTGSCSSSTRSAAPRPGSRSTRRRSTGCRSGRSSCAASRPRRSAPCRACSMPLCATAPRGWAAAAALPMIRRRSSPSRRPPPRSTR